MHPSIYESIASDICAEIDKDFLDGVTEILRVMMKVDDELCYEVLSV